MWYSNVVEMWMLGDLLTTGWIVDLGVKSSDSQSCFICNWANRFFVWRSMSNYLHLRVCKTSHRFVCRSWISSVRWSYCVCTSAICNLLVMFIKCSEQPFFSQRKPLLDQYASAVLNISASLWAKLYCLVGIWCVVLRLRNVKILS